MDGNNRWSKLNKVDLTTSYKKGAEKLFKIVDHCFFHHSFSHINLRLLLASIAVSMSSIETLPNKLSTSFGVHYAQGKAESGRISPTTALWGRVFLSLF